VARSAGRTSRNRAEHEDFTAKLYNVFRSPGFPGDEVWRRQVAGEEYDRAYDPDGPRRQATAVLASGNRTAALKRLTLPAIVIHGTADPMVPAKAGRATAAAVSGSRLITSDGMGHELPSPLWLPIAEAIAELARAAASRSDAACRQSAQ
jgi:pimeloyl-ACP methyl ester carboxylesterase